MASWDHEDLKDPKYKKGSKYQVSNDFDFGFTGVDVPDPGVAKSAQDKLDQLRMLLTPFLTNLMKDPDKKYLHWPDRVAKMTEFKAKVDSILK